MPGPWRSWLEGAAFVDEKLHGPLPDVVETQGRYLKSRPRSPIFAREHDPRFVEELEKGLERLLFVQRQRHNKYGKDAEEWPPSHTPEELKERWQEETQREIDAMLGTPTSSEDELADKQGIPRRYRKPRPNTPYDHKHETEYDPKFVEELEICLQEVFFFQERDRDLLSRLEGVLFANKKLKKPSPDVVDTQGRQSLRVERYGKDAEEWPPSHTPPQTRERWPVEQRESEKKPEALLGGPRSSDGELVDNTNINEVTVKESLATTMKRKLKDVSSSLEPDPRTPISPSTKRQRASSSPPIIPLQRPSENPSSRPLLDDIGSFPEEHPPVTQLRSPSSSLSSSASQPPRRQSMQLDLSENPLHDSPVFEIHPTDIAIPVSGLPRKRKFSDVESPSEQRCSQRRLSQPMMNLLGVEER